MKKYKSSILVALCMLFVTLLSGCEKGVLYPKGMIATDERNLIFTAILLMLIVVIPVFFMTFWFAWKYRESNTRAKYTPDWAHSTVLEVIWWTIPCIIIGVLATITWITTHSLDPYKPLDVPGKPVTIEAVALDWKWLFIYPEENIATVNFVEFPANRPINFKITADAPMNSLWIPQLGGQIYAMTGMQTKLHLIADEPGDYSGGAANFSGPGFSGMHFIARAATEGDFNAWVSEVQHSPNKLSIETYKELEQPSEDNPVTYYSQVEGNLFNAIIMKFMMPGMEDLHGGNMQASM